MIIKHCHVDKFRMLESIDFDLGERLTAIVGHNGTLKTTLLGLLSQTFSISKESPLYGVKSIDGYNFKSQFSDKFKITNSDIPGEHRWKLNFYSNIYKNDFFEAISTARTDGGVPIRFISSEGKTKGNAYPQIPVIFLSLKRVMPIGEEKDISKIDNLTIEEKNLYLKEYKHIFGQNDNDLEAVEIETTTKTTISISSDVCSIEAISAGQDNIGKILLAVLSFARLKENYGDDYKGGLILIDEIESTLHPEAQIRLINRLRKYSKDYKIQFIYTTHSPAIVKSTINERFINDKDKLIYLKRVEKHIVVFEDCNIKSIIAELNGEMIELEDKTRKIRLYSEDKIGQSFTKTLLKKYNKYIDYQNVEIGAETYPELIKIGLIDRESIVVLDGDKNTNKYKNKMKRYKYCNDMYLPTKYCPEKLIYNYLLELNENDEFWNNLPGHFDKHKCFKNYESLDEDTKTDEYKKWYKDNLEKNSEFKLNNFYKHWKKNNETFVSDFENNFVNIYNRIFRECI